MERLIRERCVRDGVMAAPRYQIHKAVSAETAGVGCVPTDREIVLVSSKSLGPVVRKAGPYLLVFAAYVLTGKAGLALASLNASATAVWPPTGISLAAVLILGPRIWPAIFLGAFVTNESTAGTTLTSLLIASGNTLEALLGGYLLKRFAGGRSAFEHGRGILLFVLLAGFVSTSVAATVGVTTLSLFGFAEGAAYSRLWLTWWLGDASGAMVVTPALIFWHASPRVRWSRRQWAELFALTVLLVVAGWTVFVVTEYPLTFLVIPACVWAAWRFGQREAATATCVLAAIAIWGSTHGLGAFGRHSIHDSFLLLQAFAAVTSIIGLTVGAAVSGRRVAEEGLRRSNEELEERVRARAKELQSAIDKLTAAQGLSVAASGACRRSSMRSPPASRWSRWTASSWT